MSMMNVHPAPVPVPDPDPDPPPNSQPNDNHIAAHKCSEAIQQMNKIYAQFMVDAPRIRIYIDDELETSPPACIFSILLNRYRNVSTSLLATFWCTQTALASIYTTKMHELNPHLHRGLIIYHLLDGGAQKIRFQPNGTIIITKPFKICNQTMQTLVVIRLRVHVWPITASYTVQWKTLNGWGPSYDTNQKNNTETPNHDDTTNENNDDNDWIIVPKQNNQSE